VKSAGGDGEAGRILRVAEATWPELGESVRRSGARGANAVLPLGATEQHGPHLPCGTDTYLAEAVAERVARGLRGTVLLLPAQAVGTSDEHGAFPGLVGVSRATLVTVLLDLARRLSWWRVARLVVVNAHGGNGDALEDLLDRAPAEVPHLEVVVPRPRGAAVDVERGVPRAAAGLHAGEAETSAMLAHRPDLVRMDRAAPGRVEAPGTLWRRCRREAIHELDAGGVLGDPRLADVDRGRRDLDRWAAALIQALGQPGPDAATAGRDDGDAR